jgi:hypothetical protein
MCFFLDESNGCNGESRFWAYDIPFYKGVYRSGSVGGLLGSFRRKAIYSSEFRQSA